ncbi:NADAR domain-containing protein [Streptomyces caniscabiei]|uniref:NADAR domain-containing protein n=1 Tax=Streptomyces caniscabiei TaxID=2746961 RepID=UPI0023D9BF42|nr:NADAR domain-containing protein [Streptomyces caniscabiei]MDX3513200.1 NADAR domain-containing protein [Streptomyces caniscabiei]MDX3718701.1 NADAR domain-containing protein [Streptomyces caniscabiei]WEO21905.1 NADAR domain-containing protein [Streptomyces caniscabiei]
MLLEHWERVKDDVMRRAVAANFRAHADIRDVLLSTGDEAIVEDTTIDHYRGRGRTGNAVTSCAPSRPWPLTSRPGDLSSGATTRPARVVACSLTSYA